jgi:oligosaccharide repeat unit polymerase
MAQFSYRKNRLLPLHPIWRKAFDDLIVGAAAVYLFISLAQAWDNRRTSLVAVAILAFNGIGALFGFRVAMVRSYPLYGVFFIFNFLFLSVAPLQQIGNDFDPIFYNFDLLITASALCAFMTAVGLCFLVYRCFQRFVPRREGFLDNNLAVGSNPNYMLLALVAVVISLGLIGYLGSALLKATREAYSVDLDTNKTATIIVNSFLRPFTVVAPLIGLSVAVARKNTRWAVGLLILLLLGIVINNPLVSARFRSSALIVFCILAVYGPQRVRLFLVTYLAGLLASPIFGSLFRYANARADERTLSQFFVNVDFSGLDIFCYAIMWANLKGFEYGSNIIGGLLFFVPRALWENKGRTVGETIHDYIFILKGFGTDNVSAPPPVEGYFSFGILGAMMVSVAVVFVIDRVERRGLQAEVGSPWYYILCLSPMLCMILLRGPFQVGVSEWAFHSATVIISAAILSFARRVTYPQPQRLGGAAVASESPRSS